MTPSARDRAIEVATGVIDSDSDCDGVTAAAIIDSLLASPDVLRALAGDTEDEEEPLRPCLEAEGNSGIDCRLEEGHPLPHRGWWRHESDHDGEFAVYIEWPVPTCPNLATTPAVGGDLVPAAPAGDTAPAEPSVMFLDVLRDIADSHIPDPVVRAELIKDVMKAGIVRPDDTPEPDEQWCAFSGDPDDGVVVVTDDLAVAEETAPLLVDGGIAYRTVTTSPWVIFPRCVGCGSVLDGELCCEVQRDPPASPGVGGPDTDGAR